MTKLPLVYNPRAGAGAPDVDALLAGLPREIRDRLVPTATEAEPGDPLRTDAVEAAPEKTI